MDRKKKAFIILLSYLTILFTLKSFNNKGKNITYNSEHETYNSPYAYYGNTEIYIGKEDDINLIRDENDGNIYIVDERYEDDPSLSIYDSYRIKRISEIKDVLEVLMQYEKEYPTEWDRSLSSLEKEWVAHNICYYLGYERNRTGHVDLDNNDEDRYHSLLQILVKLREEVENERYTRLLNK